MKSCLSVHPPIHLLFTNIRTTPSNSPTLSPIFFRMSSILTLTVTASPHLLLREPGLTHGHYLMHLLETKQGDEGRKSCQSALCRLQMTQIEEAPDQIFRRGHAAPSGFLMEMEATNLWSGIRKSKWTFFLWQTLKSYILFFLPNIKQISVYL